MRTSAFAQSLVRLQSPHQYFEEVCFSYEITVDARVLEDSVRRSEGAFSIRRLNRLATDSGSLELRSRLEWKPMISVSYELQSAFRPTIKRLITREKEHTFHNGQVVQTESYSEWLGKSEPATLSGMFFESRVNNAAITECVGSEVVWPRGFFSGDFAPVKEQECLRRSSVLFDVVQPPGEPDRPGAPPDVEDVFFFCDRFMIEIDVATGLMLGNTGYLGSRRVFCANVQTLQLK